MTFTISFSVRAPLATTWRALLDIPEVVHCLPGVELTEVISERSYAGKADLHLGPLRVSYRGVLQIEEVEEQQSHTVRMRARSDRGREASATVRARLIEAGEVTTVVMNIEVKESRILTRFGPRSMIGMAAQRMSERFAACLERRLGAMPA
ncbi:MAG TPA: SRPBCC domain-containing protein [Candidatus Dormibacteraeota bacterium]